MLNNYKIKNKNVKPKTNYMKKIRRTLANWLTKQSWIPQREFISKMEASTISIMLNQALQTRRTKIAEEIQLIKKSLLMKLLSIAILLGLSIVFTYVMPIFIAVLPFVFFSYVSLSLLVDISNVYKLENSMSTTKEVVLNVL